MLSTDTKRLEDAYGVFNREYFNGELPMVMITIQSSLKAYGHCTLQRKFGLLVVTDTMN